MAPMPAVSESADLSGAKRRIADRLKRVDSATAPELAAEFGLTDTAIRQHLETMEAAGLVERAIAPATGRGRPPVRWRLTHGASSALFTDRHHDLSVELIAGIRETLGDEALAHVVQARIERQAAAYRSALADAGDVVTKVHRIADARSAEGYLAEVVEGSDDLHLVEHHCPIQVAADACRHLCDAELEVFRRTLGSEATVVREQHLLSGDQRCAYRITLR